jgi:thiamine-phosphate pyrophosphorylase
LHRVTGKLKCCPEHFRSKQFAHHALCLELAPHDGLQPSLSQENAMPLPNPPERCRIVLVIPPEGVSVSVIREALSGGDVASVILPQYDLGEQEYQKRAEDLCPAAQEAGAAFIIAGDTRIAGRVGADGIHLETGKAGLAGAVAATRGRVIVGAGGAKTRHEALELGEAQPDYLFFGKFGFDTKAEPHPRNIALGRWWAEMVEIPCIIMGGNEIGSVVPVAETGGDFVALGQAVFKSSGSPEENVRKANALLDAHAPIFED